MFTKPSFFRLEVQFEDIDLGAVVYHPNYYKYMERARNFHMKKLGFGLDRMIEEDFIFALVNSQIKFKKPCKLHQELVIATFATRVSMASISVTQLVLHAHSGNPANNQSSSENQEWNEQMSIEELVKSPALAVEAQIKLGCIDLKAFRPKEIPASLKNVIEAAH